VLFFIIGFGELVEGDGKLWVLGELIRPQPLMSDQETAFFPDPLRLGGKGGGLGECEGWRTGRPNIMPFNSDQFWFVSKPVLFGSSGGENSSKSSSVDRISLSDGVSASLRSLLKL
jgi:hypothetical protein